MWVHHASGSESAAVSQLRSGPVPRGESAKFPQKRVGQRDRSWANGVDRRLGGTHAHLDGQHMRADPGIKLRVVEPGVRIVVIESTALALIMPDRRRLVLEEP